jgi:hypothetical protein
MADTYREVEKTSVEHVPGVADTRSEYRMTVAARIVYLLGGLLLTLLAIRFLLSLLGANRGNGFADFIYTASHPFVAPFFGLFNYTEQFGRSRFEFETLIAMVVYGAIMMIIARLVTIGSHRTDA